jgi:hypothetical protein
VALLETAASGLPERVALRAEVERARAEVAPASQ